MCGIAGFVGAADPALLERMGAAIGHRGPDAAGHYIDPDSGVHLGHRRLSILDRAGGAQPMADEQAGLVVVFNGEIYNWRELRRELEAGGAMFRSDHSDTEVLLHGYRLWGESLVERLNGMWAFVIHDRRRRCLFASSDRFGKKPLYYRAGGGQFVFASELTALRLHPQVSSALIRSPSAVFRLRLRTGTAHPAAGRGEIAGRLLAALRPGHGPAPRAALLALPAGSGPCLVAAP